MNLKNMQLKEARNKIFQLYEIIDKTKLISSDWKQINSHLGAGLWWPMSIILATQEAKIKRISVGSQPKQIVCKTLFEKTH
jgi:hypothetical protein